MLSFEKIQNNEKYVTESLAIYIIYLTITKQRQSISLTEKHLTKQLITYLSFLLFSRVITVSECARNGCNISANVISTGTN